MNSNRPVTALIAEDEPLLAAALKSALARIWPELCVVATVGDGVSAVAQALQLLPDVLFFDIQMPGLSGLQAAAELAHAWPQPNAAYAPGTEGAAVTTEIASEGLAPPFPALVFVTAYDHYAVKAFEAQAVDYLLKPVEDARLQKTASNVQRRQRNIRPAAINSDANTVHAVRAANAADLEHTLHQLRALLAETALAGAARAAPLQMIQAAQTVAAGAQGNAIRMIPVADVLDLEAADKYVRVFTLDAAYLIRTPLKELLEQLDVNTFWQIHRGTRVRASAIGTVVRDDNG